MPEWIQCPHCRFGHMIKPDRICPECKQSIDTMSEAATQSAASLADVALGMRVAGGVLLLNAALGFWLASSIPGGKGPGASAGWFGTVIDVVIGASLLTGNPRLRGFGLARAALGLVCGTALIGVIGVPSLALGQLLYSVGLVVLLVGSPGLPRIGIALLPLLLAFGILGKTALDMKSGVNPFAAAVYRGQVETVAGGKVKGKDFPYHISLPGTAWRLRKEEFARRDTPDCDRWLIQPDVDAHVIVVAKRVPRGARVDFDKVVEEGMDFLKQTTTNYSRGMESTISGFDSGKLIQARGSKSGLDLDFLFAFILDGDAYYVVMGSCQHAVFPKLSAEMKRSIESFGVDR